MCCDKPKNATAATQNVRNCLLMYGPSPPCDGRWWLRYLPLPPGVPHGVRRAGLGTTSSSASSMAVARAPAN